MDFELLTLQKCVTVMNAIKKKVIHVKVNASS